MNTLKTKLTLLLFSLQLSLLAGSAYALEEPQVVEGAAAEQIPAETKSSKQLESKYLFADLPEVKRFKNWNIHGWNAIDSQSLIIHTSPSTAYLLVLQRRVPALRFTEHIALSSTNSSVHSRFDTVQIRDRHHVTIPAAIAKIYKLKGKEQRRMVKAQIRDEKPVAKKTKDSTSI